MKKVAATKGHRVSLADFFGKTEVRADSAIVGSRAGALAAANFYGCLHAYKYSSPQRLALWKLRLSRIRTSLSGVKKKMRGLRIFGRRFGRRGQTPRAHTRIDVNRYFLAPKVKPSPVVNTTLFFLFPGTGWLTYWSRKFAFAVNQPFNLVAIPAVKLMR